MKDLIDIDAIFRDAITDTTKERWIDEMTKIQREGGAFGFRSQHLISDVRCSAHQPRPGTTRLPSWIVLSHYPPICQGCEKIGDCAQAAIIRAQILLSCWFGRRMAGLKEYLPERIAQDPLRPLEFEDQPPDDSWMEYWYLGQLTAETIRSVTSILGTSLCNMIVEASHLEILIERDEQGRLGDLPISRPEIEEQLRFVNQSIEALQERIDDCAAITLATGSLNTWEILARQLADLTDQEWIEFRDRLRDYAQRLRGTR